MQQIADEAALDAAFEAARYLLLKHSPICPVSGGVRMEVEAFVAEQSDLPAGILDVVDARALARAVAARTGIPHESPQVFLLEHGQVVWHESQWRITAVRLAEALAGR